MVPVWNKAPLADIKCWCLLSLLRFSHPNNVRVASAHLWSVDRSCISCRCWGWHLTCCLDQAGQPSSQTDWSQTGALLTRMSLFIFGPSVCWRVAPMQKLTWEKQRWRMLVFSLLRDLVKRYRLRFSPQNSLRKTQTNNHHVQLHETAAQAEPGRAGPGPTCCRAFWAGWRPGCETGCWRAARRSRGRHWWCEPG